jgi:predicted acylesterase/phospholipase RssA
MAETAHKLAPPRIGIVLSSGGVRGVYAHTGFMQALQELAIPICAATGCSAGALVGGFVASGTPLDDWCATLEELDSSAFWTPDTLPRLAWEVLVNKGRGYTGLSDTSAAMAFTKDNISATTFESCLYPLHALAVNLGTGEKTVFSAGDLSPARTASAAMPILYEPVKIGEHYYCDGALVDFAPTDAICCTHHLDLVIVHHVSQTTDTQYDLQTALEGPWAILEVINRLLFRERPWYLTGAPISLHTCPCGCGAIIIALEPELPVMIWPETTNGDKAQVMAYDHALASLKPLLDAIMSDPRQQIPRVADSTIELPKGCGKP